MPIYTAADMLKLLEGRKTILVIGPPFTGKTRSLHTLIRVLKQRNLGPLHLFDLDQKCESLVEACQADGNLDYLVLHRLKSVERMGGGAPKVAASRIAFDDFMGQINFFVDQVDPLTGTWKPNFQCGAIIIDSLSTYNDIIMEFVVSVVGHDIGAKDTDARNDYTKVMNKVKDTVGVLKALPCMSGWIAHDQIVQSEVEGKIILVPNVVGKNTLAPNLAKEFNCVLVSTTQKQGNQIKYVWQVQPEGWVRSAGVTGKINLPLFIDQDYSLIL